MDLIGERGFVDYGDAGGRGEVKHGFCDGEVFLPVGEAEFGFEISWLADDQADEVSFGIGFEQDFADFLIGVGGFAFGYAAQNVVVRAGWRRSSGFSVLAGSTISMVWQSFARSDFPVSSASGVRQSELSFTLARLTVRSAGT